jgi:1,3-beta-glucan synthase component
MPRNGKEGPHCRSSWLPGVDLLWQGRVFPSRTIQFGVVFAVGMVLCCAPVTVEHSAHFAYMQAGTLGQFAAGAEFAFGTIVQRTMAEPGGARFHYGHPDVWNKLFTMTRGGVSKATRAFHISEDVFGGYNAIFRGAVIKYKEYISVGKARDVGFAQINGFEAKVSGTPQQAQIYPPPNDLVPCSFSFLLVVKNPGQNSLV